jgi:hypothetical protein
MEQREIEERLKIMENKLRNNMFEIEKRLINMEHKEAPVTEHVDVEERLQYLEDILLTLQIESEQLRQTVMSGSFGHESFNEPVNTDRIESGDMDFIKKELANIDIRIQKLEDTIYHRTYVQPKQHDTIVKEEHAEKGEKKSNLFEEINTILKS